jgi:uncharacterized membrane protein (UPF0127 family)
LTVGEEGSHPIRSFLPRRPHRWSYLGLALPVLAVVLWLAPTVPPWRSQFPPLDETTMTVGGVALRVELAQSPEEQQRGLGYRDGLAPGTGMLFVFEESSGRSFWMKGMRFCLDMIWIDDGRVAGVEENICPAPAGTPNEQIPRAQSPGQVRFVLEVPAGWLEANDLGTGSIVTIDLPDAG